MDHFTQLRPKFVQMRFPAHLNNGGKHRSWLLLLYLATAGVLQAHAQPDNIGFISIDCPRAMWTTPPRGCMCQTTHSSTPARTTTSRPSISRRCSAIKRYHDIRSSPDGVRHCYTLRSLVAGLKYLLRAIFKYGNYDGLSWPPVFDLYVGVNFWTMLNITDADTAVVLEAIVIVSDDFMQTTRRMEHQDNDKVKAPSKVMQMAIMPCNASRNIEFFWNPELPSKDPMPSYIGIFHFSELELLPSNESCKFYFNLNGIP
ncbi:hypothetical protein PR202_ga05720 [Eleusine coracana subsp. coracana]|uniref:Malectin-like domain-containing protein n=1 Tax=Eleusine coracana subsp. coracana TaxID=191504 RepID=A0AAV5BSY5_ELECO|nr:hypothetical protein PR202_ga05720 [Eleusine coracana subsp. coracana]